MKLIIAALVCLLLAGMWLQDADAKSSEFGWSHFASLWGGWRLRQALWGCGVGEQDHLELPASISTPSGRILPEEEEGRPWMGAGGPSKRNVNLESTLTTEQPASVKGGLLCLDPAD